MPVVTQQLPLSKHEQVITSAHLPQHLQQFITAHKSTLHPRTPINVHHLHQELSSHPDQVFVKQLIHDLQYGCAIGYSGSQFSHCSTNLPSAFQQPSVLDTSLASECSAGRILGPFQSPPLPNLRCSGLGMIPKHDGGWHTIYHLSAPHGTSINDFGILLIAHSLLHIAQCMLLVCCMLRVAHCSLYVAHCMLLMHCTLHVAHCSLYVAHCSMLLIALCCSLLIVCCSLLYVAYCSMLLIVLHCSMLLIDSLFYVAHCSLYVAHMLYVACCSLLIVCCSLLYVAHCSLCVAPCCSLLIVCCSCAGCCLCCSSSVTLCCSLLIVCCSMLLIAYCVLFVCWMLPYVAHCLSHIAHCMLLMCCMLLHVAHYMLLCVARCSLCVALCGSMSLCVALCGSLLIMCCSVLQIAYSKIWGKLGTAELLD